MFDMGAGGNFGHDTAERRVFLDLRKNDIGQNFARAVRRTTDQSGGGFVAACLDAEEGQGPVLGHVLLQTRGRLRAKGVR